MAKTQLLMPAMGESIFECTVLNWLIEEGSTVAVDDMILEVATDKIDTEIGATHAGTILKFLVNVGDIVPIGSPICEIEIDGDFVEESPEIAALAEELNKDIVEIKESYTSNGVKDSDRFYSPLVLNIAKEEGISTKELNKIKGTGLEGRVTKNDMLQYVKGGKQFKLKQPSFESGKDTIVEMDRMRQMISHRMIDSRRISAHVTSFIETDMTSLVTWRLRNKDEFFNNTNARLTFTPLLIEAVVTAIKKFPGINVQVDGINIIQKGAINIGLAVALPDGNLIVPVIHNADQLNLKNLAIKCDDLAKRARNNKLKPEELKGGTYTISNIGTFGNIAGTPIIMQPQVAVIAFGAIVKKPAVVETELGDMIAIRQKMIISHSYDHRVIDGSLGGLFVKEVSDNLEKFDLNRKF
ncbi:2-oxoglutarate dehydrogenase E2 component (dihydrolipoamide succinyltransferase) [Spirosomataceae bacterium TFI 002]|nr:2-oxoglutarate dehydrogenase E2 component (dihydrolipoamide succinyltransferase) [Spirosomataceae bacterium TFI 002]